MLFPRQLTFQNRPILLSGRGRASGSFAYLDPQKGQTLELFRGCVVQTGLHFSLVEIVDNSALPAVRVDHTLLNGSIAQVNDELIVGPLTHNPKGPAASGAWKVRSAPQRNPNHPSQKPPAPNRRFGVIGQVAPIGTFGRIIDRSGNLVFVHQDQMQSGQLQVGQQVSFVLGDDGRGPKAFEVRATRAPR